MSTDKCLNPKNVDLGIFTKLGLTTRQAQVYLAVADWKKGQTVKTIAKNIPADRAEIYRALIKLEKIGLVQRYVTNPITFKATPINEAVAILLQQNAEKNKQLQAEAEQFIKEFKELIREELSVEETRYRLTVGTIGEAREFDKEMSKIKTSSDVILSWRVRLVGINRHFERFKDALERGVKMRCITYIPEGEEIPTIIQVLKQTGHFEIKTVSEEPEAGIEILDKKTAHIITFASGDLSGIEVLRSDNPALVKLLQDYFDLKWRSATPCWRKNTTKPNKNRQQLAPTNVN
ncbi:MAG: hypothetical protein NWE92_00435 [Candidatus Bathyarchaeota archaeon]|nr:hypothetical protein [Candidatus Bathyarchaeota archaeon]